MLYCIVVYICKYFVCNIVNSYVVNTLEHVENTSCMCKAAQVKIISPPRFTQCVSHLDCNYCTVYVLCQGINPRENVNLLHYLLRGFVSHWDCTNL